VIIHVGDFGAGFTTTKNDTENLRGLNNWLGKRNLIMYVIRGNHDNPIYFNGDHIYSNLKLMPDYSVIEVEGKKILMVGGAISIDRIPRKRANNDSILANTEPRYYWSTETFVFDEEKINEIRDIDIVVTHTCPDFAYPKNNDGNFPPIVTQFADEDPSLIKDLLEERGSLTKFWKMLIKNNKITHYYYGHFHYGTEENIHDLSNTIPTTTKFTCLGINEFKFHEDYSDYEEELNKKYGK
jgi:predicted phosphodiesterase